MNVPGIGNLYSAFSGIWTRLRAGSNSFDDVLADSIDRANVRFLLPEDSRLYVTEWSRQKLNEKSEWLWQNFALVKELVEGIARHTIAKGISIQLETEDDEWNQAAERDFENWAITPARCDIAGRRDFYEAQAHAIEQWTMRGEFFSAFVENPRWPSPIAGNQSAPAFWLIDSNDCRTPPAVREPDLALRLIDGVELGNYGEPLNYYVRTAGTYDFEPVPVGNMCHWFKPHATNQPRGITPLAQAVNPLVDVKELRNLATRVAKANQLVAVVRKGIGKMPSRGGIGALKTGNSISGGTDGAVELESAARNAGAGIAYVGDTGDVKMVQSNAPSPLVSPFVKELLLRDACLAPGVPMEFFWDPTALGGANTRFILGRADLFFQILADGLTHRFCTPTAVRVLAWRMENGLLAQCKDPQWMDKVTWQLPARLTVDIGREGALDVVKLRSLQLSLRSYYNARGQNWLPEVRQRIREMKVLKKMCEEAEIPEMFNYFTALDPGAQLIQNASITDATTQPEEPGKARDGKDAEGDNAKDKAA